MSNLDADVIVIGAGIIGISCAISLQTAGFQVLLLDKSGVASGASQGNAGAFAFSEIEPFATPGIIRKAPKWLFDPLGPLSLPLAYAPKLSPWLLRFWRASWRDRFSAAIAAQDAMMKLSQSSLEDLIVETGAESMFQREGQLQLYEGQAQFEASLAGWELKKQHGIECQLLESAAAIAELQPGLHERFSHAGFTPGWMNVCNPASWALHLARYFEKSNGRIQTFSVTDVEIRPSGVVIRGGDRKLTADKTVIACGAWSGQLAKAMGDKLPLDTERGYNATLPSGSFDLKTQVSFPDHGFVVSKIDGGVRVGGAVEFGGLKRKPNYERAKVLLNKASQFMPNLKPEGSQLWMGFRPSMPDSLPVIGRASDSERVVYCFGHGHLGLTQATGSAEMVRSLVLDKTPPIDVTPYSPQRFRNRL